MESLAATPQKINTGVRNKVWLFLLCTRTISESVSLLFHLLDSHMGLSAQAAYNNLNKTWNIHGTVIVYPGIEAVFDGFGVAVGFH